MSYSNDVSMQLKQMMIGLAN